MSGARIRPGCEADIDTLLDIECRAAALSLDYGAHDLFAMHSLSQQDLVDAIEFGILRVAEMDQIPVGFALCGKVDGHTHLFEMDVLPEHGQRGIGSALLESVCAAASARGHAAMTLVTMRDVPWNAPFYAARGFVEMRDDEWGTELAAIVARERMLGFPMQLRVVMQRCFPSPPGEGGAERRMREWE